MKTILALIPLTLLAASASAANTIDPNTLGATNVVQDPEGTPVTLSNPLPDPLSLGSDAIAVGHTADGELLIDAGSTFSNGLGYVGYQFGTTGTVTVDGAGSQWTNASNAYVGYSGTGNLTISDGGTVLGSTTVIAQNSSSTASATVDGIGSNWISTYSFFVGGSGDGTLDVTNGGQVSNDTGIISSGSTSVSTATIDGVGSLWSSSGELHVGSDGDGTLLVQNGGAVSSNIANVARFAGSTGAATIDGVGSSWSVGSSMYVGGNSSGAGGTGTIIVSGAGAVDVATTTKLWAGGTLNLAGGSLTTGSLDNTTGGTLALDDGTLTIDGGTFDQGTVDLVVDGATPSDSPTLTLINGAATANVQDAVIGNSNQGVLNVFSGSTVSSTKGRLGGGSTGSGSATIDGAGSSWTMTDEFRVGDAGDATLDVLNGGNVSSLYSSIAYGSSSTSSAVVDGMGSSLNQTYELRIGRQGDGTLQIQNGGSVSNRQGIIAESAGSSGSVTVDGADSLWTNNWNLYVGNSGNGTLLIQNGATVTAGRASYIASSLGSTSVATVDGADSALTIAAGLSVGSSGNGTLNVSNGGTVTSVGASVVGQGATSIGTATVDGNGSNWTNSGNLTIGDSGNGSLFITSGGTVSNTVAFVGNASGATGSVTVDGEGSSWTSDSDLTIGEGGDGTLDVLAGGSVSNTGSTYIGSQAGSTGVATVDGTGSSWMSTGTHFYVGNDGDGTLNVTGGGDVYSGQGRIGWGSTGSGAVTVDGAGSHWTSTGVIFVGTNGSATVDVLNGGWITGNNAYLANNSGSTATATVDGAGSLWTTPGLYIGGGATGAGGAGTLNVTGGGEVTVTLTTKLWAGGTLNINGGTLTTGSFDNANGGTLNFDDGELIVDGGTFDQGAVNLVLDGATAPDNPTLTLINAASTANVQDAIIGNSHQATLNINSGSSVSNASGHVGLGAGANGVVTVDGAGSSWTNTGSLYVGNEGTGDLTVSGGANVSAPHTYLGYASIGEGTVIVTGADSTLTLAGGLLAGVQGDGTLSILDGGSVLNTNPSAGSALGFDTGSSGVVNVNGAGSRWINDSILTVGNRGPGTLNITGGGTVSNGYVNVGTNTGIPGTINVGGAGSSWAVDGRLVLGGDESTAGGTGMLHITNGGLVTVAGETKLWDSGDLLVIDGGTLNTESFTRNGGGSLAFSDGDLIVDGGTFDVGNLVLTLAGTNATDNPTLTLQNGATASLAAVPAIGYSQHGSLNVVSGSSLSTSGGYIGTEGGIGVVNVSGAGSTWTGTGGLILGHSTGTGSSGTLNITAGGSVSSPNAYVGEHTTGTATVDGVGSAWTNSGSFLVGSSGNGTLGITGGGSVSSASGYIGYYSDSTGTVSVDGAGSTWTTNDYELHIGRAGNGTLAIQNGGSVTSGRGYVGDQTGANGLAVVDGSSSTWTIAEGVDLTVGYNGDGVLSIQNGGTVTNANGYVGQASSSTAVVTVAGAGSTWTNRGDLYIGGGASTAGGSANLTVQSGGLVHADFVVKVWNTGQVNLAAGTINATDFELAGGSLSGFGTVNANISGGSTITATGGVLSLGNDSSSAGFAFSGATIITNSGTLELHDADAAELGVSTVLAGGALVGRSGMNLGFWDSLTGYGIVVGNVTGPGNNQLAAAPIGTVDFRGTLELGLEENATFYSQGRPTINGRVVVGGGTLFTPTNSLLLGSNGILEGEWDLAGTAFVGDLGSTTIATDNTSSIGDASSPTGFYSNGAIEVKPGATLALYDANDAVLDSAASVSLESDNVEILKLAVLTAANGLTLDFGGNITGYGAIDTPDNPATPLVNNGHIVGNSPSEPIMLSGYVKGVGTLDNVLVTGTDAPGFSPATVNRGSVTYDGTLEIELAGTGVGQFDQLNHILGDGVADLGGVLDVRLLDGFTPAAGDVFTIITADTVQDTFDTELLPDLAGGLLLDVLYGPTMVQLVVAGVEGDYNLDGIVDAADYTVWRDSLGQSGPALAADGNNSGMVDEADFGVWKSHFGQSAASGAGSLTSTAAVPEPSTAMLLMIGVATILACRGSRCRDTCKRV